MIKIEIIIDTDLEPNAERVQHLIEAVVIRTEMEFHELTGKMNSPIRVNITAKEPSGQ